MARLTWVLGATTLLGAAASVWLYLENRELRDAPHAVAAEPQVQARTPDPWSDHPRTPSPVRSATIPAPPILPDAPAETALDRRVRHTDEFAAMFGRAAGETDDQYRARIVPMMKAALAIPRAKAIENRKLAEDKAHVTPEQSAKLDQAFTKVYSDVLDYTNKAITDGQLSPYERNVAGWLDYAGGMGGILDDAQGQVGKILDPGQVKAMYDSGFEWGEYLGLQAPWEQLTTPPPPK